MRRNIVRRDLQVPVEKWGAIKGAIDKLRWLEFVDACIAADIVERSFAHLAIRIATKWINGETGLAWRGAKNLADDIGMSEPTVIRLLASGVAAGLLGIAEQGQRGSGHSTILRLEMPKGKILKPAEVSKTTEILKSAEVSSPSKTCIHGAGKPPSVSKKTSTGGYEPLKKKEPQRNKPIERAAHAHGAGTSVADRESDNTTEPLTPNQRASHEALVETVAAKQPSPSATSIGTAAANGADADPAFAEAYERCREVFGADADAVTAKLLSAYEGDVESVLDAIAAAEQDSNPRRYVEKDIEAEAAARLTTNQPAQEDEQ